MITKKKNVFKTQPVVGTNWAVIVKTPSDVRTDWIFSELMPVGISKRRRNLQQRNELLSNWLDFFFCCCCCCYCCWKITVARWIHSNRCVLRDWLQRWCSLRRSKRRFPPLEIQKRSIWPGNMKDAHFSRQSSTNIFARFTWKMRLDGWGWLLNGCQISTSLWTMSSSIPITSRNV